MLHTLAFSMFFVTGCPTHVSCRSVCPCLTSLLICLQKPFIVPFMPLTRFSSCRAFPNTIPAQLDSVFIFCVMWPCSISCVSAFQVWIFKGYLGVYEGLLPPLPDFLLPRIDPSWSCRRWSLKITSSSGTLFSTGQFSRKAFQTDSCAGQNKAKVHWNSFSHF